MCEVFRGFAASHTFCRPFCRSAQVVEDGPAATRGNNHAVGKRARAFPTLLLFGSSRAAPAPEYGHDAYFPTVAAAPRPSCAPETTCCAPRRRYLSSSKTPLECAGEGFPRADPAWPSGNHVPDCNGARRDPARLPATGGPDPRRETSSLSDRAWCFGRRDGSPGRGLPAGCGLS